MDYEVKIIADSVSPAGHRLTTLTATYPRIIHSEVLTHRDRARNSASSRAIPFPKMVERIDENPFVPLSWQAEQKGMQGGNEIPEALRPLARAIWKEAYTAAKFYATALHNIEETALTITEGQVHQGMRYSMSSVEYQAIRQYVKDFTTTNDATVKIHKAIPNRIVEPWMWITVVMSATEWKNFFRLRVHKDAEQHFQKIAGMMQDAMAASKPRTDIRPGDWHVPFMDDEELPAVVELVKKVAGEPLWSNTPPDRQQDTVQQACLRISTARCSRVSYLTHEGKRDLAEDLNHFEKLNIGSGATLPHASPYEHVAECGVGDERSGPFIGWRQFRKQFPHENVPG